MGSSVPNLLAAYANWKPIVPHALNEIDLYPVSMAEYTVLAVR